MNSYQLKKREVEYELKIRGLSGTGKADELRKRLSKALSSSIPASDTVIASLDPATELEECHELLKTLKGLIKEYEGDKGEYSRISARLLHLSARIERIPVTESTENDYQAKKKEYGNKTKGMIVAFTKSKAPESNVIVAGGSGNTTEAKTTTLPAATPSSSQVPQPAVTVQETEYRPIPVYKWGLQFNNGPGESVGAFLQRVEELRRARGVSENQLFRSAVDLFSGGALIWYRSTIERIKSWSELCKELKIVFQTPDYDDMLINEIRNRTQGSDEPIDLFIAAIEGLYGRLSVQTLEADKLRTIQKNLNPWLLDKLCMFDIKSIEELRQMGRKAELGRLRTTHSRPPPRSSAVLEPDLAYVGVDHRARSSNRGVSSVSVSKPSQVASKCWNCNSVGHRFRECRQERKRFCFRCGTQDTIRSNCPNCSKNLKGGESTEQK